MASENNSTNNPAPPHLLKIEEGEYHVFLCHNSRDKDAIRGLKILLEQRGLKCWFDEDELRPGLRWQKLLEEGIQNSKSVVVAVANSGLGPWEEEEMNSALELAVRQKMPVIPVLLPGASAKPDFPLFLSNRTWVDLRQGYTDSGVDRLVWGITGKKANGQSDGHRINEGIRGKRRKLWIVLSGILGLMLMAGIAANLGGYFTRAPDNDLKPKSGTRVKVAIGIKEWVGYTPFAVAKQMDRFPPGIDVTFVQLNSATEVNERLASGQIQIGFLTIADLVGDADRNFRFRPHDPSRPVALFMVDTSRGADGFVARQGVNSVDELTGLRFIYQKNDVSDFMLKQYCDWNARTAPNAISFTDLIKNAEDQKADAAADKFRNDDDSEYAAVGTYEPHLSQITEEIPGTFVIFDSGHKCVDGSIVDIAVAQEKFLEANKEAVRAVMIGWFRAVDLLNNAPGVTPADNALAVDHARRFNSRSKLDSWDIDEWLSYEQVSIARYQNIIKGLAGSGTRPWPDIEENADFFRLNGSTSNDTSEFHEVFDKWKVFLKLPNVTAKNFDGSGLGLDLAPNDLE